MASLGLLRFFPGQAAFPRLFSTLTCMSSSEAFSRLGAPQNLCFPLMVSLPWWGQSQGRHEATHLMAGYRAQPTGTPALGLPGSCWTLPQFLVTAVLFCPLLFHKPPVICPSHQLPLHFSHWLQIPLCFETWGCSEGTLLHSFPGSLTSPWGPSLATPSAVLSSARAQPSLAPILRLLGLMGW